MPDRQILLSSPQKYPKGLEPKMLPPASPRTPAFGSGLHAGVQGFNSSVVHKLGVSGWVDSLSCLDKLKVESLKLFLLEAGSSKILAHGASESLQYHSGRWWIWGFLNVFLLIRNPLNSEPRTLNLKC
jgi:hypothetical protein